MSMQQILSSAKLLVEVVREWRNVVKAKENCSYAAGVDEQLIAEKTGHRSSSVRAYKRTSDEQQQQLSKILHGDRG